MSTNHKPHVSFVNCPAPIITIIASFMFTYLRISRYHRSSYVASYMPFISYFEILEKPTVFAIHAFANVVL